MGRSGPINERDKKKPNVPISNRLPKHLSVSMMVGNKDSWNTMFVMIPIEISFTLQYLSYFTREKNL